MWQINTLMHAKVQILPESCILGYVCDRVALVHTVCAERPLLCLICTSSSTSGLLKVFLFKGGVMNFFNHFKEGSQKVTIC